MKAWLYICCCMVFFMDINCSLLLTFVKMSQRRVSRVAYLIVRT